MAVKKTLKHFGTWSEILIYLDNVDREYTRFKIPYLSEIWFSEIFNSYKIYITLL